MDAFDARVGGRAATIDEVLCRGHIASLEKEGDADLAARRFAAWQQSSAAGDPSLFARRLERDGLSITQVSGLFAATGVASGNQPAWLSDAAWIDEVLHSAAEKPADSQNEAFAFEDLLLPLVARAETLLWSGLEDHVADNLDPSARAGLAHSLLHGLAELCAAALYERFAKGRDAGMTRYADFVAGMKAGGFRQLFEAKPVLLRLIASLTRQWIATSREFLLRLDADLPTIRREFLPGAAAARVTEVASDLSDPHNGGHSVLVVSFADGARVVYKPKDLQLDMAWHALVERLNCAGAPVDLKAVRALPRDGYGWTEFIAHTGCADGTACERFFRRAGASLALLHVFVATDMHQENIIAAGEYPVPVDLETILQPSAEEHKTQDAAGEAFDAAMAIIGNSVMTVGLLPAYGRSADNSVFAMGGLTADWGAKTVIAWNDINTDTMRPTRVMQAGTTNTNLPHVEGRYAKFTDHVDSFVGGFADYATFLMRQVRAANPDCLLNGFAGVTVRKVVRPTRFYYMLLQRLRNYRIMDDGIIWSAQADFVARLAEWDGETDPLWPLHRAERAALLALNVPHFVTRSDGQDVGDAFGISVHTDALPGLTRARDRLLALDDSEIAWQVEVIRANTNPDQPAPATAPVKERADAAVAIMPAGDSFKAAFIAEADSIAGELSRHAIRRGDGAAWIGLDWLGDSENFQLVCLGPDLYNGATGIALFLAAHAAVAGCASSAELALAGVAQLRGNLKSRNAPRIARALGIGGATGLGSIVYALTVMSRSLGDDSLLADAQAASRLFSDELIAADNQLDVMSGSAGAILGLLRLYRDSADAAALERAVACGEHLLAQSRHGPEGRRSWIGQGFGINGPTQPLNGMSHGAAGFAYALASLAARSGRDDFADAASECLALEDSRYDANRHNWPDLRVAGRELWPCQWCHGATGIGLARFAMAKHNNGVGLKTTLNTGRPAADIGNAVAGAELGWPSGVDTLCCGTLGSVELFCEAASDPRHHDLRGIAARRLMTVVENARARGDYRWNGGKRQFTLGLFRGLAGVGYTLLRQAALADGRAAPPNVLIWE